LQNHCLSWLSPSTEKTSARSLASLASATCCNARVRWEQRPHTARTTPHALPWEQRGPPVGAAPSTYGSNGARRWEQAYQSNGGHCPEQHCRHMGAARPSSRSSAISLWKQRRLPLGDAPLLLLVVPRDDSKNGCWLAGAPRGRTVRRLHRSRERRG
jgi:hypothetical protein